MERDGGTRSMCGVLNTVKSLSFKGSGTVSRGSLSFLDRYACIAMFFLQNAIVAVTHGPSRTLSKCHRNRKTSQATLPRKTRSSSSFAERLRMTRDANAHVADVFACAWSFQSTSQN